VAGLLDAIDKSISRYERRFADLLPDSGGAGATDFRALMQQGGQAGPRDWGSLLGGGGGLDWGGLARQAGGTDWGSLLSGGNQQSGVGWRDLARGLTGSAFDRYDQLAGARQAAKEAKQGAATTGQNVTETTGGTGTPGQGWGAPTTQQLDTELAGSPLQGQGATIAAIAQRHGVPVTVAMGILRQESSYGRNSRGNNYGGLMNADGSHTLAQFATVQDGLEAVIGNMGTPLYRGKTIAEFMNTYAPPSENDTSGYIQNLVELDHRFGGHSDWNTVVTGGATAPTGGYSGAGGLPSLTGGAGSISQDFQVVDPTVPQSIYNYGQGSGVHGHTGLDWSVPPGTQVYMPAGLSGTVTTAGGTAFFRDEDENGAAVSPQGQGELKIHLSNGMDLILGHMRNISVPVGTALTAGQLVGLSGSATGGHVHVELRVPDSSMPNGYRIIDPRTVLGG
jgi:murein DD-endopeptidase MepM/ murein hydrolase activator NlpD